MGEDRASVERIAQWIQPILAPKAWDEMESVLPCGPEEWPYQETMATCCDRTLGTDLTDQTNRHMIKWCAAFCDEGEAAWPMPSREDDLWRSCTPAAAEIVTDPDAAFHRAQGAGPQELVVVTGCLEFGGYCRPHKQAAVSQVVA